MTEPVTSQPRARRAAPRGGFLAHLGRWGIDQYRFWAAFGGTLGRALASLSTPGRAAVREGRRITLSQIFFTGFEGLPFVTAAALIIGATVVLQTAAAAPGLPGETMGMLVVAVVLRELAPLVTAIIIASRSGAAIATELATMKVNLELLGLSSLGIDPPRFVVLPRLVGVVVSVGVLTVYFSVLAVVGCVLVGLLIGFPNLAAFRYGLAETMGLPELVIFLVKCGGCGLMVGWICCHYGLQVGSSRTEVPIMASKAVVRSVVGCVVYNAAITVAFYWVVGPPIH